MTFNQAPYIRQALDSALGQKTDFPVQVLVHDDCSIDGTREIVESYRTAHPERVCAILQEQNQFSQGRRILRILVPEMKGDYLALLDGDDFWQDDGKLQLQADFLDAHPDCALCQTQTLYFNDATGRVERRFPPPPRRRQRLACGDLAAGNFIQTSAVMFRETAVPDFPADFEALPFGDYAFYAMLAQSGWIGYIDKPMATYRVHSSNLWFARPRRDRVEATHKVLRFLAAHLRPELRGPWIVAAGAPRLRSPSAVLIRTRMMWHGIADRVRLTLGMQPR
jgi:glycosyltransferase involved in cell wall biosynthesis